VLSLPDAHGRYYLMTMLDTWTMVFQVPGKRIAGPGPQVLRDYGPQLVGTLPARVTEYKSPTALVWIPGRIYCTGTPEDYKAVGEMQEITLVPLGSFGKLYTPAKGTVHPSVEMKTTPREQVNALDVATYFNLMAHPVKDNPPTSEDTSIVAQGENRSRSRQPFDATKLSPDARQALMRVPKAAIGKIIGYFKDAGKNENGYLFTTKTGMYGTDYLNRALVTAIGLGANRPQDAVYPSSQIDAEAHKFILMLRMYRPEDTFRRC
jgi:hypothetical protein